MRTTITIEDGLLAEAKRQAQERKTTLKSVLNEALQLGLLQLDTDSDPEASRPLLSYGSGGVQPGVDLSDSASLLSLPRRPGN